MLWVDWIEALFTGRTPDRAPHRFDATETIAVSGLVSWSDHLAPFAKSTVRIGDIGRGKTTQRGDCFGVGTDMKLGWADRLGIGGRRCAATGNDTLCTTGLHWALAAAVSGVLAELDGTRGLLGEEIALPRFLKLLSICAIEMEFDREREALATGTPLGCLREASVLALAANFVVLRDRQTKEVRQSPWLSELSASTARINDVWISQGSTRHFLEEFSAALVLLGRLLPGIFVDLNGTVSNSVPDDDDGFKWSTGSPRPHLFSHESRLRGEL